MADDSAEQAQVATKLMTWLFRHWFVLGAILSCGVAAGQALGKVATLEDTIKDVATVKADTQQTKETLARHEERFKAVQDSQARQEAMLQALLMGQRQIATSSTQIRRQLNTAAPTAAAVPPVTLQEVKQ